MTTFRSATRWLLAALFGVGLMSSANAQLTEYTFTGTYESGDQSIGTQVTGSVILDLGVQGIPGPGAPNETIFDGSTAINVSLNGGLAGGSATGGNAIFDVVHVNDVNSTVIRIRGVVWESDTPATTTNTVKKINLFGFTPVNPRVADAVPNPWDFLAEQTTGLIITVDDPNSNADLVARYTITSFTKKLTTVVIGGIDTGIADVIYRGQPLSVWMRNLEATSANSAVFFARVFVLATQLNRERLITAKERNRLLAVTLLYILRR